VGGGAVSKVRFSIVCVFVGFFAGGALGFRYDLTTVSDWVLFLVGCYFFGALILVAAVAALTFAGCEVSWPRPRDSDPNDQLMRATLTPTRRYLGWSAMIGGLVIGQGIPLAACTSSGACGRSWRSCR